MVYDKIKLENLALELAKKASALTSQLPSRVIWSLRKVVCAVNCYYAYLNLKDISPRIIDHCVVSSKVLKDPEQHLLQLAIDPYLAAEMSIYFGKMPECDPTSDEFLKWMEEKYHQKLPEKFLLLKNTNTLLFRPYNPWQHYDKSIIGDCPSLQGKFVRPFEMSHVQEIITLGAAFHWLCSTKPFIACNLQAAFLMTCASLKRCGVNSYLWSVARGVVKNYRKFQELIESQEKSEVSGPSFSYAFGECFLVTCIKEIEFMASLLNPEVLLYRMRKHIDEEERKGSLLKGSFRVLREALLLGEVSRSSAGEITGYEERTTRKILTRLLEKGYLQTEGKRNPLVLGFPLNVIEQWFPELYPHESVNSCLDLLSRTTP